MGAAARTPCGDGRVWGQSGGGSHLASVTPVAWKIGRAGLDGEMAAFAGAQNGPARRIADLEGAGRELARSAHDRACARGSARGLLACAGAGSTE